MISFKKLILVKVLNSNHLHKICLAQCSRCVLHLQQDSFLSSLHSYYWRVEYVYCPNFFGHCILCSPSERIFSLKSKDPPRRSVCAVRVYVRVLSVRLNFCSFSPLLGFFLSLKTMCLCKLSSSLKYTVKLRESQRIFPPLNTVYAQKVDSSNARVRYHD